MRKNILLFAFVVSLSTVATPKLVAQETAEKATEAAPENDDMKWNLINSGIFFAVVGYAAVMYGPKFFQTRGLAIQKAIKDATGLKIEADFRYSEIDKKMSNLSAEVTRMKAEAAAEMEREHQRMKQETASEIEHMQRNTEAEIDSLRADGSEQVKRHTAQLALSLAERRLQGQYSQADAQGAVREFINLVYGGKN